jgi:phosphatidylglycerol---prolipoprotein diacylglyceryl transferase
MYGVALAASAAGAVATTSGVPFFHCNELVNIGIPIQAFGVIVAAGVLIGASLLRRYAEWHGVSDEHIRGITGWITVAGFAGAHIFDVLAYQYDKFEKDPVLFFKVWDGISSYGGFLGGAIGFAVYVWWKRLPVRLFADISIVGLLPAFSIGRIGCTIVSDHIGGMADPDKWYSFLAMEYPSKADKDFSSEVINQIVRNETYAGHKVGDTILAWNLGLIEFLYLVPVCAIVLYLAFRSSKRVNAGFVTVLTGVLYAPVRFFLDFLRPENSDPRHLGLTFAQWASLLAFGVAAYAASKIFRDGAPAETVTRTAREAQERLKVILKEDEEREKEREEKEEPKSKKRAASEERDRDDDDDDDDDKDEAEEKEAETEAKDDDASDDKDDADEKEPAKAEDSADESEDEDADDEDEKKDEKPAPAKSAAPASNKPKPGGNKNKKKNKKKRR